MEFSTNSKKDVVLVSPAAMSNRLFPETSLYDKEHHDATMRCCISSQIKMHTKLQIYFVPHRKWWVFCGENKDLFPLGLKNVDNVTVIRGTCDLAEDPFPSHTVLLSILPVSSALRIWCKRWFTGESMGGSTVTLFGLTGKGRSVHGQGEMNQHSEDEGNDRIYEIYRRAHSFPSFLCLII